MYKKTISVCFSLFLITVLSINTLYAYTPLSERKVIFVDNMKGTRKADTGSLFSSPKASYHSITNKVRYLRARQWNVIQQRMVNIPNFNSHEEAARFYLSNDSYGPILGIKNEAEELEYMNSHTIDSGLDPTFIGRTFVRFKQLYNDIWVFGGEIIVQLNARNELLAIIGEFLPDINLSTNPSVSMSSARQTALNCVALEYNINASQLLSSEPELIIYNPEIVGGGGAPSNSLAWSVHVESTNSAINEIVLVEARFDSMEITHFQEKNANLLNYSQSGAIAHAMKMIQTNIKGPDSNQPDRMSSPFYECSSIDNYGVETNSHVIVKASYLMAEGGFFNNKSVAAIGHEATRAIFNEAKSLLTSASDFEDLFHALLQSCHNLGYSSFIYDQVKLALLATEMNKKPCLEENPGKQIGNTTIPACDSGVSINDIFFDGLENSGDNWISGVINNKGTDYWFAPQTLSTIGLNVSCASTGNGNIWSYAQANVSDTYIAMNKDIKIPANSFLHFDHAFKFDNSNNQSAHINGGIVEYSLNGGASWTDAANLFVENQYNGVISSSNSSLNGRSAFVSSSQGYISSKLALDSLKNNNIRFRFRMVTSDTTAHYGWYIDNIRIYTCDLFASIPYLCENPTIQSSGNGDWNSPSTWSPHNVPTANDLVHIQPGQTVTITTDSAIYVRALFNEGKISTGKNNDMKIYASSFVYNCGRIWACDGDDGRRFTPGSDGRSISLYSYAVLNNETGDIQAGRGGNHISYLFFTGRTINSRGGNGGNININCFHIINNGIIGPDKYSYPHYFVPDRLPSLEDDGGNGGVADNWNNSSNYNYGIPQGGNGGNTSIFSVKSAVNNGWVASGIGGYAHYAVKSIEGIGGSGGDVNFWAPSLDNRNGEVHAGVNGSILWDPEISISGKGSRFYGAKKIMIFGGNNWSLNLHDLDSNAISAETIIIGVGEEGALDVQNSSDDIFESDNPIFLFADNILDGDQRLSRRQIIERIPRIFNSPLTLVSQSEELYEFNLSAYPPVIKGKSDITLSISLNIVNNGPRPDSYSLSIKDSENLIQSTVPDIIDVTPGSQTNIPIELRLPAYAGELIPIIISAQSVTSPDRKETLVLPVVVQPEIAAIDISSNDSDPLHINCIPYTITDSAITSYLWDFGDNTTSSAKNPSHQYQKGGTYPVSLTLKDSSGKTETIRKRIAVQTNKILLLAADYIQETKEMLVSTGLLKDDDFDIMERPSSITLADLAPYNAILVWSNYPFSDPENIGDTLREYVDNGGGLVIASYSFTDDSLITNIGLKGGILAPEYSPFLPGESANISGYIDMENFTDPDHYIFNGVDEAPTFWTGNVEYESNPVLNTGADILAQDSDGHNIIAINDKGNIIGIAIYPERLSQGNMSTRKIFANALLFVSNDPAELNASSTIKNVRASEGQVSFEILNTGNGILHWIAETDDHWLRIEEGASGTDRGFIKVSYDSNDDPDSSRTGTVHVSGIGALNSPLELQIIQANNQAPVISEITDQATLEDTRIEIPITVNDIDSSSLFLNISARAMDTELVSDSGISFSNPGSHRILKIDPTANRFGSTDIIVSVNDGINTTSTSFNLNITPVNDSPSFIHKGNIVLQENAGPQTFPGWAFNISEGLYENQNVEFIVTADDSFFSVLPEISPEGTLKFTANGSGSTTVTAFLSDNGGTDNGGINISATQSFNIRYQFIPHFQTGSNPIVLEDSGQYEKVNWATNITVGPFGNDETVEFHTTTNSPELFSIQPKVSKEGTLTFQSAPDANGYAIVKTYMTDGGESNNQSELSRFFILIKPVNDQPAFTASDHESLEDSGPQYVKKWATNIDPGPFDEKTQSTRFFISNNNNELFRSQPDVLPDGTLTYTAEKDANGTATISVYIQDNGGIDNDGAIDTGVTQEFLITVKPVNDIPSFQKGEDIVVLEDAQEQNNPWAYNMSAGPQNEKASQSLSFNVTTDNEDLFSSLPAVSEQGKLIFTVEPCKSGKALVCARIKDDGGVSDGGVDESDPQCSLITVEARNDKPSFELSQPNQTFFKYEVQEKPLFVSNINVGKCEQQQSISEFFISTDNDALFDQKPDISNDGTLTYKPSLIFTSDESATVTVYAIDDGRVKGESESDKHVFTITYAPSKYSLNLSIVGDCGQIKINGVPHSDQSWIELINKGDLVKIEAISGQEADCQFQYWTGDIENSSDPLIEFLMDNSKSIIANFGYDSDTFDLRLNSGWNMISFPKKLNENSISEIFTDAVAIYGYTNGSYYPTDTIEYGIGFWVKIPEDNIYTITGESYSGFMKEFAPGWHLIGCPDQTVFTDCNGSIIVMYKYENGSYKIAESCEPGLAYWIKLDEPDTCDFMINSK